MEKSRIAGQIVCVFLLALALVVTGTQGANAQGGTGQIKGVVVDPSGAVIPGRLSPPSVWTTASPAAPSAGRMARS